MAGQGLIQAAGNFALQHIDVFMAEGFTDVAIMT